jgi:hypothetical protein
MHPMSPPSQPTTATIAAATDTSCVPRFPHAGALAQTEQDAGGTAATSIDYKISQLLERTKPPVAWEKKKAALAAAANGKVGSAAHVTCIPCPPQLLCFCVAAGLPHITLQVRHAALAPCPNIT